MKSVTLFVVALAVAAPARAQHNHDQSSPPPAPQRGEGPQTPPIEVPWNDAIPAGTVDHAARALKESPRHGEWVDIKMADGTALKSWVVNPEKSTKTGVVIVIHDIRGMADITRAVGDQLAQDGEPGGRRRRQSEGRTGLMAAGGAVLREEPEMNPWFDGR